MSLPVVFADKRQLQYSICHSNGQFSCIGYAVVYTCIDIVPYYVQDLIGNEIVFLITPKITDTFGNICEQKSITMQMFLLLQQI